MRLINHLLEDLSRYRSHEDDDNEAEVHHDDEDDDDVLDCSVCCDVMQCHSNMKCLSLCLQL